MDFYAYPSFPALITITFNALHTLDSGFKIDLSYEVVTHVNSEMDVSWSVTE